MYSIWHVLPEGITTRSNSSAGDFLIDEPAATIFFKAAFVFVSTPALLTSHDRCERHEKYCGVEAGCQLEIVSADTHFDSSEEIPSTRTSCI